MVTPEPAYDIKQSMVAFWIAVGIAHKAAVGAECPERRREGLEGSNTNVL